MLGGTRSETQREIAASNDIMQREQANAQATDTGYQPKIQGVWKQLNRSHFRQDRHVYNIGARMRDVCFLRGMFNVGFLVRVGPYRLIVTLSCSLIASQDNSPIEHPMPPLNCSRTTTVTGRKTTVLIMTPLNL
jgi:hypothetical protein